MPEEKWYIDPTDFESRERGGQHTAVGDIGRSVFGGLTPEQQQYAEYVRNMLAQPIEGREQYAGRYAQEATKAARPGLMAASQKARGQAASYLARQGAPTGRTAATQAQISNSLAQSMAAMQASAMAAGMQAHEGYRQNEQARRDAAMSQLAGMQGQEGLVPAAVSYGAGRLIDAGMTAINPLYNSGGGSIYKQQQQPNYWQQNPNAAEEIPPWEWERY